MQITRNHIKYLVRESLKRILTENSFDEEHGSLNNTYFNVAKTIVDAAYQNVQRNGSFYTELGDDFFRQYNTEAPHAKPQKVICPECGATNPPDSQYCDQCGSPLPAQQGTTMRVCADADTSQGSLGTFGGNTLQIHFYPNVPLEEYYDTVIHEFTHAMNSRENTYGDKAVKYNRNAQNVLHNNNDLNSTLGCWKNLLYYFNYTELMARISGFGSEIYNPQGVFGKNFIKLATKYGDYIDEYANVQNKNMFIQVAIKYTDSLRVTQMQDLLNYFKNAKFSYELYQAGMANKNQFYEPLSNLYYWNSKNLNVKINFKSIKDENTYQTAYANFYQQLLNINNAFMKKVYTLVNDFLQAVDIRQTINTGQLVFRQKLQQTNLNQRLNTYKVARQIQPGDKKQAYDTAKKYRNMTGYQE